jgi:hypothetical protein
VRRAAERRLGAGDGRLAGRAREDQLPARAVPSHQGPPRRQDGHPGRCGVDAPAAYHLLRDGTYCDDLGIDHFDVQNRSKAIRRLLTRLQDLGCNLPEPALMSPRAS